MPIGMIYVSSYLKEKGYDVRCFNLNHYSKSELAKLLQEHHFDLVGTGGLFTHVECIRSVIKLIREYSPNSKIVIGGGIASGDPEFIFDELKPDFSVIGEGEVTTDNLLKALKSNSSLHNVTGIAFKEYDKFIKTPSTPLVSDINQLPYPDYEGFGYGHYLENFVPGSQHLSTIMDPSKRRVAFLISSRDCIVKCTFCFRIMGGNFRIRSIDNLFGEINCLIEKYDINEVQLMDDMFAASKERVYEFCERIKPLRIP